MREVFQERGVVLKTKDSESAVTVSHPAVLIRIYGIIAE